MRDIITYILIIGFTLLAALVASQAIGEENVEWITVSPKTAARLWFLRDTSKVPPKSDTSWDEHCMSIVVVTPSMKREYSTPHCARI